MILITMPTRPYFISSDLNESTIAEHKITLDAVKNKIASCKPWRAATSDYTDINILIGIANRCKAQNISRAWLKFWEIIHRFSLIPTKLTITVFSNCELPGGGISAINHYVKTLKNDTPPTHRWLANSLMEKADTYEPLNDRFGLVRGNPKNWIMTRSMNGNILTHENRLAIIKRVGKVDLYTGDGGIGCDEDGSWNDQEETNQGLIEAEVAIMTETLATNGSMFIKLFTLFTPRTRAMLEHLAVKFAEFHLFKPATSGTCNSELYMVGVRFTGNREPFTDFIAKWDKWPEIIKMLTRVQTLHIETVLNNIKCPNDTKKQRFADAWITRYDIPRIHPKHHLKNGESNKKATAYMDPWTHA